MGEAEAPRLKGGGALVIVMTTIVAVMITVVVVVDGVGAAGMTGTTMKGAEVAGTRGTMMEGAEVAGTKGMMMEEDAGTAARPLGAGGAQSGRAARSAEPRLNSGTVSVRQSSEEVPVAGVWRRAIVGWSCCLARCLPLYCKWTCVGWLIFCLVE